MAPKVVGSYAIGSLLGSGNYGEVRLSEHLKTKKKFAIKIIPKEFLDFSQYSIDVRREMSILMVMRHPNIIRLHDASIREKRLFLVMELAEDGDLFCLINRRGALPERTARDYFHQLLDAVSYCHRKGVYHRDLKPENILLTNNYETVKLADFGFAAVVDKYSSVHPLLRTNCGSPHYCAPEVWNGEHRRGYAGSKADAFSCGVILYCMLVGVQPFYDSCDNVVLEKVNRCEIDFPPVVQPRARDLIRGLLRRNPAERLCIREALAHPWMTDALVSAKRFDRQHTWQSRGKSSCSNSSVPETDCSFVTAPSTP